MARIGMTIIINWNQENDGHSQNFEPLFSPHSKTMMLKMKVDIHVFSAVENLFFMTYYHWKTLIQTLDQMSQTSRRKFGVNSSSIITSK